MKVKVPVLTTFSLQFPRWATAVGALAIMVFLIAGGDLVPLAAATGLMFFAVISWYQPIPLVLMLLVLSTEVFQFVSLEHTPYLQLAPGTRLNSQDIAVLLLLLLGGLQLLRRREWPMFGRPLFFLFASILLASVFGWMAGTTNPGASLNAFRAYSGYLFYVGLVGVLDRPKTVKAVVNIVFVIIVISVCIQLVEAAQGERIVSPLAPASEYFGSTKYVDSGGTRVPYLWNRATGYLFLGLFLAFGVFFAGQVNTKHILIGLWAGTGLVIALVRQWLVLFVCGVLMLGMLLQGARLRMIVRFIAVGALILAVLIWISRLIPGLALLEALRARVNTIIFFQEEANYVGRILIQRQMLTMFGHSPMLGYGPGSGLIVSDVGIHNALVELGLVGTASIVYLIGFVFVKGYRGLKRMTSSLFKGYLGGLLAAWAALAVGYSFSVDFIGQMSMMTGLAMALLDRTCTFAGEEGTPESLSLELRNLQPAG
ncbi:MAG: O-antigen ligase family protein [candidate division KSB1 bacterium]|nr:O-antigen ligase family protein [candidate division KSB1 bacterium]